MDAQARNEQVADVFRWDQINAAFGGTEDAKEIDCVAVSSEPLLRVSVMRIAAVGAELDRAAY
jgi:hypothetical protein